MVCWNLPGSNVIEMMSRSRIAWVTALLICAACRESTGPDLSASTAGSIVVRFNTRLTSLKRDLYDIESLRIDGDTLHLKVQHSGGCATHEYGLVAYNGWMESEPVQVGATLLHDGNGDQCDALLQPELRYDLTPLRLAYAEAYRTSHGTIVIQLSDPSPGSGLQPASVTYTF